MKIALVRGAFLAQYETQLYYPLVKRHEIIAFSSLRPYQEKYPFKLVKLPSPMDISFGPFSRLKMPVLNRLFIDAHWLVGLEDQLKGFDIAHCADTFYHFTHQCVVAKGQGKVNKVVATIFENIPFNNEGIWGRKKFKKEATEGIDHFIAISERSKASLLLEGVQEEKITVIGQRIDTSRFKPNQEHNSNNNLTILFSGRLEFYKGIYEVIYSAKRLLSDRELSKYNLRFLLVGEGSQKSKLNVLINQLKINQHVQFKSVTYDQMPNIYHQADIFVAPSRATPTYQEQFSTVLLEAQASGLPIVTTGSGGIPENIESVGLIANPGDFYSISEALKKFILNPKMRKTYGEKARRHVVSKFDIEIGAGQVDLVYQKVMSK